MSIKTLEEFTIQCDKKRCPRNTMYNDKTCVRTGKRETCWDKYNRKLVKDKEKQKEKSGTVDLEWEVTRKKVWMRDANFFPAKPVSSNWKNYCRLWKVLNLEDRAFLNNNYSADLFAIGQNLDLAHAKGRVGELKHDIENIYLISRFFHSRLDQYKHPVTGKPIDNEERTSWFNLMKN